MNTINFNNSRISGKFEKGSIAIILMLAMFLVAGIFFSGCTESLTDPSTGSSDDNVTISAISDDTQNDNPASIQITVAKALINEVELEGPNGLHQYRRNPFVINFDVNGGIPVVASSKIPPAGITKIKFQVHKPEDNETPPDPEFKEGNSGNQRYSFIIKGTYNGTPFVFKSRKSVNIVMDFSTLVNISTSKTNLTMVINKLEWFLNNGGELDPSNSSNQDAIEDNIKNSFKRIFRDDNRDGRPDDNS